MVCNLVLIKALLKFMLFIRISSFPLKLKTTVVEFLKSVFEKKITGGKTKFPNYFVLKYLATLYFIANIFRSLFSIVPDFAYARINMSSMCLRLPPA